MTTLSPQLIVRLFRKGESSKLGKICRLRRVCGRLIASTRAALAAIQIFYRLMPWAELLLP